MRQDFWKFSNFFFLLFFFAVKDKYLRLLLIFINLPYCVKIGRTRFKAYMYMTGNSASQLATGSTKVNLFYTNYKYYQIIYK